MNLHQVKLLLVLIALFSARLVDANEPIIIAKGEGPRSPKQPQAAVSEDGSVYLVYGVGEDVFYCQSSSSGESFDQPKLAFRVSNLSLGMRRGPRIAVAGKSLVITAVGGAKDKGKDGDLLAWRSSDAGATWQGPTHVNDSADSAREGLHGMAAGPDGAVWCVWLDLREKRTEIYAAHSKDGGETWLKNVLVYHSPDGSVCECCHPSISVHGESVHVLFRNSIKGNRDMYLATSIDRGAHFTQAKMQGVDNWQLDGCPMDGGMLAIDANDVVTTTWRRGGLVYFASNDRLRETVLGRGEQPWIAATSRGPIAVWTTAREGELFISNLSKAQPHSIASIARHPMIAAGYAGRGPVIACWESTVDGKSTIMATKIDLD